MCRFFFFLLVRERFCSLNATLPSKYFYRDLRNTETNHTPGPRNTGGQGDSGVNVTGARGPGPDPPGGPREAGWHQEPGTWVVGRAGQRGQGAPRDFSGMNQLRLVLSEDLPELSGQHGAFGDRFTVTI